MPEMIYTMVTALSLMEVVMRSLAFLSMFWIIFAFALALGAFFIGISQNLAPLAALVIALVVAGSNAGASIALADFPSPSNKSLVSIFPAAGAIVGLSWLCVGMTADFKYVLVGFVAAAIATLMLLCQNVNSRVFPSWGLVTSFGLTALVTYLGLGLIAKQYLVSSAP